MARVFRACPAYQCSLWHAAALGLTDRLAELLADSTPSADELSQADINAAPDYGTSPLEAAANLGTQRDRLIEWLRAHGAHAPLA